MLEANFQGAPELAQEPQILDGGHFSIASEPPTTAALSPAESRSIKRAIAGLFRLARPHQWIKNVLVFVAPAAAGVLLHPNILWHAIAAFGIFCVAASGTYCMNDAIDAPSDRLHPTKRFRPVAVGTVPVGLAISVGAALYQSPSVRRDCSRDSTGAGDGPLRGNQYRILDGVEERTHLGPCVSECGLRPRAIAGGVATGVVLSDWFIIP